MKRPLILLHGALGSAAHWQNIKSLLMDEFHIYCPDFPGHGNSDLPACNSVQDLSDFLADYIQYHQLKNPSIIGYSMGAYVALKAIVSYHIPCERLICLATKMDWSADIAIAESANLAQERLAPIWDKLQNLHGKHLDHLLSSTSSVLMSIGDAPLGPQDMSAITCPCLVLRGDKDKMVKADENTRFVAYMSNGTYLEMLEQGHLLERMDPVIVTKYIRDFFA